MGVLTVFLLSTDNKLLSLASQVPDIVLPSKVLASQLLLLVAFSSRPHPLLENN